jgi:hypothetical protein
MPQTDPNITEMVETFASSITAAVEASIAQRIQAAIADAFGAAPKRGPGRPPKPTVAAAAAPAAAAKKSRPKQLCPVPGCKNLAAPVFGMVCSDHKNVAKSKIKKYRLERKGKTTVAPSTKAAPAKKAKTASPKVARARKLQGKYLGAMRALSGDDRARVKAVAREKGVAEAVKLAMTLKKPKA